MKIQSILLGFCLFLFTGMLLQGDEHEKGFVCVPVADLMVDPYFKMGHKKGSITDYYQKMPFSGSWDSCRRAHQLLFNETVTIIEDRGNEVKIKISNFYYRKSNESTPEDTYWTLRKNICFFKDLKYKTKVTSKLPPAICYKTNNIEEGAEVKTVTLKKPFLDPVTKEVYSVGTRFVSSGDQDFKGPFDKGHFEAYVFDSHTKSLKKTQIPKVNCVRNYSKKPEDKIQNFVQVLRLWAYQKEGAIPYVLGGWSWTVSCPDQNYEILKEGESNTSIHRQDWSHSYKAGFDCMGMIGRAAQVCNIPFYIKNTTTLLKDLKSLEKNDKIQEGDILWYPGHVMVVSSVKKNLIIEARGYERGEGKVQEVSIQNIFKDITSLKQLKEHYDQKKPVTILYYDGRPWRTFKKFKILKFSSIWE